MIKWRIGFAILGGFIGHLACSPQQAKTVTIDLTNAICDIASDVAPAPDQPWVDLVCTVLQNGEKVVLSVRAPRAQAEMMIQRNK